MAGERTELGRRDVDDAVLRAMVGGRLGGVTPTIELLTVRIETVDYDLSAITTGGRWWVRGEARVDGVIRPWSSSSRCAVVVAVSAVRDGPEEHHARRPRRACRGGRVPRYRSTSPPGCLTACDAGAPSACSTSTRRRRALAGGVDVPAAGPWDLDRFGCAAHLLGRMRRARSSPSSPTRARRWTVAELPHGRLATRSCRCCATTTCGTTRCWPARSMPSSASGCSPRRPAAELRRRAGGRAEVTSHGDACPNNLLAAGGPPTASCSSTSASGDHGRSASTSPSCSSARSSSVGTRRRRWRSRRTSSPAPTSRGCAPRLGIATDVDGGPTPSAADLHRAVDAAVRAPRGAAEPSSCPAAERAALSRFSLDLLDTTPPVRPNEEPPARTRRYCRVILAELEVWHTRPLAPTRRVSLGNLVLPVDPPPGFGGLLLGAVSPATSATSPDDLVPDVHRLIDQVDRDARVVQPRLRHRFQVDRHGLALSRHRLIGDGEEIGFDFHTHGLAAGAGPRRGVRRRAPGPGEPPRHRRPCCTRRCGGGASSARR